MWRDLIPIPVFALLVTYIFYFIHGKRRREHVIILFAFSLLGIVTGHLTGQSREPIVGAVLPAVLSLIGGVFVYALTSKKIKQQVLISGAISIFTLNLLVGTFWGTRLRIDHDNYLQSYQYRIIKETHEHNIRLKKLIFEDELIKSRKIFGLDENQCNSLIQDKCYLKPD